MASPFNIKARMWIRGRINWKSELKKAVGEENKLIWVHCSSLGEFEQGRPFIEELHDKGEKVLLTFFSPSGYENQKDFKAAFHVSYLPADSLKNAQTFLEIASPKAAFFVKYEFWFNYIEMLRRKKIPLFLISGVFRNEQYFFKFYGRYFAKQLKTLKHLFVQDESSKLLLESIGIDQVSISGDTRIDRVWNITSKPMDIPEIEQFAGNSHLFVAGSTWPEDEELLSELYAEFKGLKLVIVPHDVSSGHIENISKKFPSAMLFSEFQNNKIETDILIVDVIGKLSSLYRYAHFAYIGGGFGKGIHNTLEPAAYGIPIAFGPNYHKFKEAREMLASNGARLIKDLSDLRKFILDMQEENVKIMGEINKSYIMENLGATKIIVEKLENLNLIQKDIVIN